MVAYAESITYLTNFFFPHSMSNAAETIFIKIVQGHCNLDPLFNFRIYQHLYLESRKLRNIRQNKAKASCEQRASTERYKEEIS